MWLLVAHSCPLSHRHCLSCQLEPPNHGASKMLMFFKAKKNWPSSQSGSSECLAQQWLHPGTQQSFGLSWGVRQPLLESQLCY